MKSYPTTSKGYPVTVFESEDPEEMRRMVDWCRTNIGRGHGPGASAWWIVRVSGQGFGISNDRDAIAMSNGPHLFLAQIVWA